jgi:hypothetical protein
VQSVGLLSLAVRGGRDDIPRQFNWTEDLTMKMLPLQLVIIDLENGKRGVFVGRPLISDGSTEEDCQVENVWFTEIHEMPDNASLEQLTRMALEQMGVGRTLQ